MVDKNKLSNELDAKLNSVISMSKITWCNVSRCRWVCCE